MVEGVGILIILAIIVFVAPRAGLNLNLGQSGTSSNSGTSRQNSQFGESIYAGSITIGTGNASRAYQPYEEYITISNKGREEANISGWSLKNGKDKRGYELGGELRYYPSDVVFIGQGTLFTPPTGTGVFQDIILKPGERAVLTTGSVGAQTPYKITSFKENICSGYLEDLDEYNFSPALERRCPRPANEVGLERLDTECRQFVERMSSCHTPEFETRDSKGEICYNCVDGKPLSSSCRAFIQNHFNYDSCLANHGLDDDFSSETWRIFLGRSWEFWAEEYETIELLDQSGQLIESRSY